jgi:hypothetical protein
LLVLFEHINDTRSHVHKETKYLSLLSATVNRPKSAPSTTKTVASVSRSVHPSVCLHVSTLLPLDGFTLILVLEICIKIRRKISFLIQIGLKCRAHCMLI